MTDPTTPERNEALSAEDSRVIAESLTPIEPPVERAALMKARIMQGVHDGAQDKAAGGLRTIAVDARDWKAFTPGVEICVLHEDADRRTALLRMQPGSFLFSHYHDMDEESVILEGEAILGEDVRLGAGDYQFAPRGEAHPIISSPAGCIVLVHGERRPRTKVSIGLLTRLVRYVTGRASQS